MTPDSDVPAPAAPNRPWWRRVLRVTSQVLLAPIVLFEHWGWEPLQRALGRLARFKVLEALERFIAQLPPYVALVTYAVPGLTLIPLKLAAAHLILHGHPLLGVGIIIGAKVVGTAVVARLFHITKPKLLEIPWFARFYATWVPWRAAIVDKVNGFAIVRGTKEFASDVKRMVAGWLRRKKT